MARTTLTYIANEYDLTREEMLEIAGGQYTTVTDNAIHFLTGSPIFGSIRDHIADALGEWTADHDMDAIEADYRESLEEVLPLGWTLAGDSLIAPVTSAHLTEDETEDLRDAVEAIGFWSIVERHQR